MCNRPSVVTLRVSGNLNSVGIEVRAPTGSPGTSLDGQNEESKNKCRFGSGERYFWVEMEVGTKGGFFNSCLTTKFCYRVGEFKME